MKFTQQPIYCCICGLKHTTDFHLCHGGIVCSAECYKELEWRKVLAALGKHYRPQEKKIIDKDII